MASPGREPLGHPALPGAVPFEAEAHEGHGVDMGQHGQLRGPGPVAVEHEAQPFVTGPDHRVAAGEEALLVYEPCAAPPVDHLTGPSLTVSRRLGHASVSFTLDKYSHLMPDDDQRAA